MALFRGAISGGLSVMKLCTAEHVFKIPAVHVCVEEKAQALHLQQQQEEEVASLCEEN